MRGLTLICDGVQTLRDVEAILSEIEGEPVNIVPHDVGVLVKQLKKLVHERLFGADTDDAIEAEVVV